MDRGQNFPSRSNVANFWKDRTNAVTRGSRLAKVMFLSCRIPRDTPAWTEANSPDFAQSIYLP
jgi:hypothetical protein